MPQFVTDAGNTGVNKTTVSSVLKTLAILKKD